MSSPDAAVPRGWVDLTAPAPAVLNLPNIVTAARTVAGVVLAVAAVVEQSVGLAVAAYLSYWIGDMLDGLSARLLKQETRFGAVLDITCDRLNSSMCVASVLVLLPDMAPALGMYVIEFMVIDLVLSLAFLNWPLVSPNYFGLVDRRVYLWNWSPLAKVANGGGLVILVLLMPSPVVPMIFVALVTVVKILSLREVIRLMREQVQLSLPTG